ncbi:hypothetical protein AX16_007574, partial [Volvariella volvacea WC 439]
QARTPGNTPVFQRGDNITGSIYLSVGESDSSVHTVTLTVTGQFITSAYDQGTFTFLEHTMTIWSKTSSSSARESAVTGSKLSGGYSWPFCIPFPEETTLPHPNGKNVPAKLVHTPASILKRSIGATIQYELTLRVCRGWFKSDSRLGTSLIYIPQIIPKPLSPLMQLAYRQGSPLPSPKADQEGWHTPAPVTLHGCVSNWRSVHIQYTLSLAYPLCYARGSVIPLSLTIKSQDSEALRILSSPNVVDAVFKRRVRYYRDASFYFSPLPQKVDYQVTTIEDVSRAVWWTPSQDDLQGTTERRVEGEIHLEDILQPSSSFPLCIVENLISSQLPPLSNAAQRSASNFALRAKLSPTTLIKALPNSSALALDALFGLP